MATNAPASGSSESAGANAGLRARILHALEDEKTLGLVLLAPALMAAMDEHHWLPAESG